MRSTWIQTEYRSGKNHLQPSKCYDTTGKCTGMLLPTYETKKIKPDGPVVRALPLGQHSSATMDAFIGHSTASCFSATSCIPQLQRGFCVTDRAYRLRSPSPRPLTLTCNQTTIHSPGLPFDGFHSRIPCNYMAYYSFTDSGGTEE